MERRVERSFLQLKRARTASLGLPEQLVAVHFALVQEAQNQNADGAGEEFSVVLHVPTTLASKVTYLAHQGPPEERRRAYDLVETADAGVADATHRADRRVPPAHQGARAQPERSHRTP